jgi:starvation-inducible DNA-binding protein
VTFRQQSLTDNDARYVSPQDMLAELREDNQRVVTLMRETHAPCDKHRDIATASLLEIFIDEADRRVWVLYEASRRGDPTGS